MSTDIKIYVSKKEGDVKLIDNAKLTDSQLADAAYQIQTLYEQRLQQRKRKVKPIQRHIKEELLKTGRYYIAGLGFLCLAKSGRPSKKPTESLNLKFIKKGRGVELRNLRKERQALVQAQQGAADNETPPIESGSDS